MDEEDERRLWLSRLELAALQAMDLQATLWQEVGAGATGEAVGRGGE